MLHDFYSALVVCGFSSMAIGLVRFRMHQKRKARELYCMKRLLATVCK